MQAAWRGRGGRLAVVSLVLCGLAFLVPMWLDRPSEASRQRLLALQAAQGAWDNPWDAQERKIASLRADLQAERHPGRRLVLWREIAQQQVNAGLAEQGIATLEAVLSEYRGRLSAADRATLEGDLAFAYFRIGEQQNCGGTPDATACILPLDPTAVHRHKLGAAEAARRYEALLADPGVDADHALLYRWLLNVAAMQLGRHPDGVPERWRIGAAHFASEHDLARFKDVAAERGIVELGRAGGAVLEDFDNDGDLDLMVSHMGLDDPMAYFVNDGRGRFQRRTTAAGLDGLFGGLNIVQADYDNDGCIDVYVPRGAWYHDKGRFPASLLRGDCRGGFVDVAERAGVLNDLPSQTAVWADFDGDGRVDLFVGNEIVAERPWPAGTPNFRLYRNRGNGRFVDVGPESGIVLAGMVKGATAGDFNNDGRIDLYVSVMGGPNRLFRNTGRSRPGQPHFEDVTARAGVAEPAMSFTTWFFDYDNDGWLDLFVSGYSARMPDIVRELLGDQPRAPGARARLYRNNGDGTFADVTREAGLDHLLLTMGANHGDLDNDGWLDFYLGTGAAPLAYIVPNRMYRNDGGRRFHDVTTAGGFGHLQKGHAVAFGDIDGDGQQDVFANIGGAMRGDRFHSALFKNPGHRHHHWLRLELVGQRANRFAIGARLRVRVRTADGQVRDIHRTAGSGGSFGASSLRPLIGIGEATQVEEIEVRWPGSGLVQRLAGPIAADVGYRVREGEAPVRLESRRAPPGANGPIE
mgnify:CR=1 FL=1